MRLTGILTALALGVTGTAGTAATVGFELTLSGNSNVPTMSLTNISDTALLENITITIGDTSRNFDAVTNLTDPNGGTSTLSNPDMDDSGATRSDELNIGFAGFDPSEVVSWDADVDIDSSNSNENYRTVLFNNGTAPNSVVTAAFSTSPGFVELLRFTMPDGNANDTSFTFTATNAAAPIPAPAALPLLLTALGGLGFAGWRRRRAGATRA